MNEAAVDSILEQAFTFGECIAGVYERKSLRMKLDQKADRSRPRGCALSAKRRRRDSRPRKWRNTGLVAAMFSVFRTATRRNVSATVPLEVPRPWRRSGAALWLNSVGSPANPTCR